MSKEEWIEAGGAGDVPTWDRTGNIEGKLVNKQSGVGPNESWLYTVETADGQIGIWGSSVLDTKFSNIAVGSKVKIEALGKTKSPKTGREYQDYKVYYSPGEAPVAEEDLGKTLDDVFGPTEEVK